MEVVPRCVKENWGLPTAPVCHITPCQLMERRVCLPTLQMGQEVIYFIAIQLMDGDTCVCALEMMIKADVNHMCYYVGSGDSESIEVTSFRGSEPTLFTDKMISGNRVPY